MLLLLTMKIAIYIGTEKLRREERLESLIDGLEKGGCKVYVLDGKEPLKGDTDMLLSVGGDGTFLSAAMVAAGRDIPVAGVNMGRMGFLSENRAEDFAGAARREALRMKADITSVL